MFDATRYQLDALASYPADQWKFAVGKFPPPSNRPPGSFWRSQRDQAIALLSRHGVPISERCGKVYVSETMVDGSYIAA